MTRRAPPHLELDPALTRSPADRLELALLMLQSIGYLQSDLGKIERHAHLALGITIPLYVTCNCCTRGNGTSRMLCPGCASKAG